MSTLTFTRYELVRAFRNRRFFMFTFGFPVVLYFVLAGPQSGEHDFGGTGVSVAAYYMTGLASFGTMMAMISTGARIANERQAGWTRQLRVTPLPAHAYLRAKLLVAYAMALASLLLLYLSGVTLGVRLATGSWLEMTGLIIVGLLPFGALGIALGHLLNVDAIGPLVGGLVSLLALVSGTWFPVTHGFLHDIGQCLPSYWLVKAGQVSGPGATWGVSGWVVVLGWALALSVFAAWAYRRDSGRV